MNDNYFRILAPNFVGLSLSMADVEQGLRLVSLSVGIVLTVAAYYRSEKKRRNDENNQ